MKRTVADRARLLIRTGDTLPPSPRQHAGACWQYAAVRQIDFAAIEGHLEFIAAQLARRPTRGDLAEIRRRLYEVQADQAALRRRQEEFERHALAAPSTTWAEAAAKAGYLILFFAEASEARYPRRQELIAKVLDDLARLSD